MKVLLIRIDRLGDLVCTLPVDQHPLFKNLHCELQWLITKGLGPVLQCSVPPRRFHETESRFTLAHFFNLISWIKSEQFSKVILFYAPWWITLACLIAKIPVRVSPRSRWHQWLFFNRTLIQSRSRSEKHESEYNWDLVHWSFTNETTSTETMPYLALSMDQTPGFNLPNSYIVIHPGMGGSALNYSSEFYLNLIMDLTKLGKTIVITGTSVDQEWLVPIESKIKNLKNIYWLAGQLNLSSLIYVLSRSEAVIAPSTGVIHLAASTGVKSIGLYSPIRVQSPTRWKPRGFKAKSIVPSVNCPATTKCLEAKCHYYSCLNQITPSQIILELLNP